GASCQLSSKGMFEVALRNAERVRDKVVLGRVRGRQILYRELQDLVWNRLTEFVGLLFERLQQEMHGTGEFLGRLTSLLGCNQRGANDVDRASVGLLAERLLIFVAVPILV